MIVLVLDVYTSTSGVEFVFVNVTYAAQVRVVVA